MPSDPANRFRELDRLAAPDQSEQFRLQVSGWNIGIAAESPDQAARLICREPDGRLLHSGPVRGHQFRLSVCLP